MVRPSVEEEGGKHMRLQSAAPYWTVGLLAVLGAAILVNLPALDFGWFGDDYAHRRFILDHLSGVPSRVAFWNMFDWRDLANRDEVDAGSLFGRLPWWAAPGFSFALLRPLSTLSHFVDYMLWPSRPVLMHWHNVALYCGIVALAGCLYRRLLDGSLWALVPTLFFAIDDAHVISTAWIASRNTLLTTMFVLTTLWLYIRSVDAGTLQNALLTSASLLCAHACSEGAITVWGYVLAYAAMLDRRPTLQRLKALAPLAAVSVVFLTASALLGYGVHGSAVYVDPRSAPGLFASMLGPRMLDLLRLQLTFSPELAKLWASPWSSAGQLVATAYPIVLALVVVACAAMSARLRFFALACLGALLPQCAAGSFSRLLLLSGFAAHGLIFTVVYELFARRSRVVWSRFWATHCAWLTFVVHGVAALDAPRHALAYSKLVDHSVKEAAASLPVGASIQDEHIFVLNFPDYLRSVFVDLYRRELCGTGPRFLDVLGVTPARVQLTRVASTTIELSPEGGYLLEPTTMLVRTAADAFQVGTRYNVSGLDLDVVRITSDGRPAVIRVSGARIAEDATLWFRWNALDQRFVRLRLPDVGETLWLDSSTHDVPQG